MKDKKSLQFDDHGKTDEFFSAVHCNVLSNCNIDDLDTSKGSLLRRRSLGSSRNLPRPRTSAEAKGTFLSLCLLASRFGLKDQLEIT